MVKDLVKVDSSIVGQRRFFGRLISFERGVKATGSQVCHAEGTNTILKSGIYAGYMLFQGRMTS